MTELTKGVREKVVTVVNHEQLYQILNPVLFVPYISRNRKLVRGGLGLVAGGFGDQPGPHVPLGTG